jgi:hypothetical protein
LPTTTAGSSSTAPGRPGSLFRVAKGGYTTETAVAAADVTTAMRFALTHIGITTQLSPATMTVDHTVRPG